jgi:hypothetical protein
MAMQQTMNSFSIALPATKRSEGAWDDTARFRAAETVRSMQERLQGRAGIVVLNVDESELLAPFVRAYFSTVSARFKELCEPATLVIDIGNAGRVRYWLDGLMREEGAFLLAYATPTYHFFGTYPPYTEEIFYALLDNPATPARLASQLDGDATTVAEAIRHLVEYRVARQKGDSYYLQVPRTMEELPLLSS